MSFLKEGSSSVWSRLKCFQAETALGIKNPVLCVAWSYEVASTFPYLFTGAKSPVVYLFTFTADLQPQLQSLVLVEVNRILTLLPVGNQTMPNFGFCS